MNWSGVMPTKLYKNLNEGNFFFMHRPIIFFTIAVMMLALPELMQVSMQTVSEAGNSSPLAASMQGSMKSMTDIMGVMCYIGGLMFGIRAALALKEYAETGGTYREEEPVVQAVKIEKKPEVEPKVEIKIEKKPVIVMPANRTGNKELDALIILIEKKSAQLLLHPQIESDISSKLMVEKSLDNYVPKVVSAYNSIPLDMKNKKIETGNAHEMTKEQLNLIISGLEEVELNLLNRSHDKLRVNEKILKQAFGKSELEMEI